MFNAPKCPKPDCVGHGEPLEADLWKSRPGVTGHVLHGRVPFTAYVTGEINVAVWFCSHCGHVERPEDLSAWSYDYASVQFALKLTAIHTNWKRLKMWFR